MECSLYTSLILNILDNIYNIYIESWTFNSRITFKNFGQTFSVFLFSRLGK